MPIARSTPAGLAWVVGRGRWQLARHLALLNERLVELAAGRVQRLLVAMPPRHGKSELISKYLPAWFLGAHPDRRVLLASYESQFARSWGRKARDVLADHGREVFGVAVRRDSTAADRWDLAGHTGGMASAGVGGPITGKGADLVIIDDPVKNAEQAHSKLLRDKTWDWYQSVAYTRLEPDGRIVLVQTRWHGDDLAGRLLDRARRGGEPWTCLVFPALADDSGDPLGRSPGEALWPERFPRSRLLGIQRTLGGYWFSALYQQRPAPPEGAIFRRHWFRYWRRSGDWLLLGERRLPWPLTTVHLETGRDCENPRADRTFGIVDLAISQRASADYTVISAWLTTATGDLVLLDLVRERLEAPRLVPAIEELAHRYQMDYVGIEKAGFQEAIIQEARRRSLAVRPLIPRGDKTSRAAAASVRFEAGSVYFPADAPWLADLEAELLAFPNAPHDDQVDCVSYACLEVARWRRESTPIPGERAIKPRPDPWD